MERFCDFGRVVSMTNLSDFAYVMYGDTDIDMSSCRIPYLKDKCVRFMRNPLMFLCELDGANIAALDKRLQKWHHCRYATMMA
jgi:hypothetical protein